MKRKLLAALIWLAVWQLAALLIHNEIVLAGPWETAKSLWELLPKAEFLQSLLGTGLRVFCGLLCGCIFGALLAAAAWKIPLLSALLEPLLTVLKTAPIVSFVLLLLIWRGAAFLSFAISLIVVLPIVYLNTLSGLDAADGQMLEMARLFRIPLPRRLCIFYHELYPAWASALRLSVGMSWKSGIAAEVIGQPLYSVGNGLYRAKIYLDTAGVLAWTVAAVILSLLLEKLLLAGFAAMKHERSRRLPIQDQPFVPWKTDSFALNVKSLTKRFGENVVLKKVDTTLHGGEWVHVRGASGIGKTTLLRLLAGLTTPDGGTVTASRSLRYSAVFQEDRLLEDCSALKNVRLAVGAEHEAEIISDLEMLLGKDTLYKKASELSGGMRRRVSLVRACLSRSDVLILDEPFTGLDSENRAKALAYIRSRACGRLVLIATHDNNTMDFDKTINLEEQHEQT